VVVGLVQGGHGPFRGLDAPFSAEASVKISSPEVNQLSGNRGPPQNAAHKKNTVAE